VNIFGPVLQRCRWSSAVGERYFEVNEIAWSFLSMCLSSKSFHRRGYIPSSASIPPDA
jgi:hypothetical protein